MTHPGLFNLWTLPNISDKSVGFVPGQPPSASCLASLAVVAGPSVRHVSAPCLPFVGLSYRLACTGGRDILCLAPSIAVLATRLVHSTWMLRERTGFQRRKKKPSPNATDLDPPFLLVPGGVNCAVHLRTERRWIWPLREHTLSPKVLRFGS